MENFLRTSFRLSIIPAKIYEVQLLIDYETLNNCKWKHI